MSVQRHAGGRRTGRRDRLRRRRSPGVRAVAMDWAGSRAGARERVFSVPSKARPPSTLSTDWPHRGPAEPRDHRPRGPPRSHIAMMLKNVEVCIDLSAIVDYASCVSPFATFLLWFQLRSPELAEEFERLMAR